MESSLGEIVNRHEVLRSVILEEEGQAYQQVLAPDGWSLSRHDAAGLEGEALQDYIEGLISRRFDLSADHMLRCDLLQVGEGEYILVLVLHHIASDGWSTGIIIGELVELYDAYLAGRAAELPELGVQYADYALWQRSYLSGAVLEEKLSYWQEQLTGVETLNLPTDYVRPAVQSTQGALLSFELGSELSAGLQSLSQQHGVTLFMTLLSAFKVLLMRYSGQSDICVGSPVAGRMQQEVEGLVGFFINTLALRSDLSGDPSFTELLGRVRETTLSAYEHQDVPFEKVVERVVKHRDMSRSPLFDVKFALHNLPERQQIYLGEDLQIVMNEFEQKTAQLSMSFDIVELVDFLSVTVTYCTDLYTSETIDRLFGHYRRILGSVLVSPDQPVSQLEMLSDAERDQLV
ncbi:MAG: condensation domain-containing protein, partial [Algiphilus sp.]|uniref:condensation domain-containing protein n=1 Tax=Algiphilus sp. TaxID=1872431 RepID=UPI0032EAA8D7